MELNIQVKKDFLDLFTNDIKDLIIDGCKTKINLFVLRFDSNQFAYNDLIKKLYNATITFCLSRVQYGEYYEKESFGEMYNEAVRKLRDYKSNSGESGEILLYCFLETHLNAPKILTKLELKTSSNDYVKGSDGVHLLYLGNNNYQLIFGESKLDAGLTTSLTEAFKSIYKFINRDENNIEDEISLVSGNILKEAFNEELYQFLKDIIKPKATSNVKKNNAFGIFAGFEIKVNEDDKKLDNIMFEEEIRKRIKHEVEKKYDHIKQKINDYQLWGYSFYIYIFPFIELETTRRDIIKKLKKND